MRRVQAQPDHRQQHLIAVGQGKIRPAPKGTLALGAAQAFLLCLTIRPGQVVQQLVKLRHAQTGHRPKHFWKAAEAGIVNHVPILPANRLS